MKQSLIPVLVSLLLCSACNKETEMASPPPDQVFYKATITSQWNSPAFSVPPGAHFTTFIGMVHNEQASLWKEGTIASAGMEVLAESGGGGPILAEIDSMINRKNAASLLLFVAPPVWSSAPVNFTCTPTHPYISFASMLGPTPDWFTGISSLKLYQNGWIKDTTIMLYTWDAGTEEGDAFGYNNPATVPVQAIHKLAAANATVLANGNTSLGPIATVRFQLQ